MSTRTGLVVALGFGWLLSPLWGCQLVTAVNREEIPEPVGGGGQGGEGASQGGGGQGGNNQGGASQGGGGQGGGQGGQGGGQGGAGGQGGGGTNCNDGMQNGNETDVDCGGSCPDCMTGQMCAVGNDCVSGSCIGNTCVDVLLISEVQTRGTNGGGDEFVELYNPSAVDVTLSPQWTLRLRSAIGTCDSNQDVLVWTGAAVTTVPAHGHLLIANGHPSSGYDGTPTENIGYMGGSGSIPDAASVWLMRGGVVVDAVCFHYDAATQMALATCSAPYICEGASVMNNHDNTAATDADDSIERRPGGPSGNGTDTNVSSADFQAISPALPQNNMSPATP